MFGKVRFTVHDSMPTTEDPNIAIKIDETQLSNYVAPKASVMTHPEYDVEISDWNKFRLTFDGGQPFIQMYLKKFSIREDETDFINRREMTYCPAHAKAAVMDIKNAIYQRMIDIVRKEGAVSWRAAISGSEGGVDLTGNSMNGFVGRIILPELLSMRKVGVFIDKPRQDAVVDIGQSRAIRPYLYAYRAEDIRNWSYDGQNNLIAVLLRDTVPVIDEETKLVTGTVTRYRRLTKVSNGVEVIFTNESDEQIGNPIILNLEHIPFVIAELNQSLLTDIANYQIALLNLGSSDINYALQSNFPFYTEQYSPASEMGAHLIQSQDKHDNLTPGTSAESTIAKNREIKTGASQGRKYPKGVDRPNFINPSSEPLKVSMEKQDRLISEIRQLINLNLNTLEPTRASAESKKEDHKGLESGLSYIGLELEYIERQIATIWNNYERSKNEATIVYPQKYSLRSDKDRREEAKELNDIRPTIPSVTYQKEISKQIVDTTLGTLVPNDTLAKINKEIEAAKVINTDHEIVRQDHEAGFVSTELASTILGYPKDEVAKAKKDHAERAARILKAQTAPGSRGVEDIDGNPKSPEDEKEKSRNTELEDKVEDKTRGDGK